MNRNTYTKRIEDAIRAVTGYPYVMIISKARSQDLVYCRVIYTALMINIYKYTESDVAKVLKTEKYNINHYVTIFRNEIETNQEFKNLYENVKNELTKASNKTRNPNDMALIQYLKQEYGFDVIQEFKFSKTKNFRFDFAIPELMIAIEKEGGIWRNGRHNRPTGFLKDIEKYNLATSLGWSVMRATPDTILSGEFLKLVRNCVESKKTNND